MSECSDKNCKCNARTFINEIEKDLQTVYWRDHMYNILNILCQKIAGSENVFHVRMALYDELEKNRQLFLDSVEKLRKKKNHLHEELGLCTRCGGDFGEDNSENGLCSYCVNQANKEKDR